MNRAGLLEAARLVCEPCAKGAGVVEVQLGKWVHVVKNLPGVPFIPCSASALWRKLNRETTTIIVECHPTLGRNNSRFADRRSKRLSDEYKSYRDFVGVGWLKAGEPRFERGVVGMQIIAYWDRQRHLDDNQVHVPVADVDAIDKGTLDVLQEKEGGCGCIDDDVRIQPLILDKGYDPNFPRVEITLWQEK